MTGCLAVTRIASRDMIGCFSEPRKHTWDCLLDVHMHSIIKGCERLFMSRNGFVMCFHVVHLVHKHEISKGFIELLCYRD